MPCWYRADRRIGPPSAGRWPNLARWLSAQGVTPVIIGAGAERALAEAIRLQAPEAIDLTDRTDLMAIAALGRGATLAIGNDTGPMHLLAAAGAPSLVLFSAESDPARCAPRGKSVSVLQVADLSSLSLDKVTAEIVLPR